MIACTTDSVEATRGLAASIAGLVTDGDLIVLMGDLGAGKTVFVQGFAGALEVSAPVTSPTFTLANRYDGTLTVNHLDVYRLESLREVHDLDLPELLESGVTLIEWGDTIRPALPPDQLEVRLAFGPGDDDRRIELRASGPGWLARARQLRDALEPWIVGQATGSPGS